MDLQYTLESIDLKALEHDYLWLTVRLIEKMAANVKSKKEMEEMLSIVWLMEKKAGVCIKALGVVKNFHEDRGSVIL